MKYCLFFSVLAFVFLIPTASVGQQRWAVQPDGGILWQVDRHLPHYDHIEMSGQHLSAVLRYGVNADGSFSLERSIIWPMLRTIPNNTHASLTRRFGIDFISQLQVNGRSLKGEQVKQIRLDGLLTVVSEYRIGDTPTQSGRASVQLTRVLFPATDQPAFCERYVVKNISDEPIGVVIPTQQSIYRTDPAHGVSGAYVLTAALHAQEHQAFHLQPGAEAEFVTSIHGRRTDDKAEAVDVKLAEQSRRAFVKELWSSLVFHSPDTVLNTAFAFAKIRAAESIFKTKGGYMHAPGGEAYYAAIWANDQAEYINPFFPFLSYGIGHASAMNSFRHFARFMNPDYNPLPSSIIAEGDDTWAGVGDRGDAAMVAYGAARYALARGKEDEARELWPLITWCLTYSKLQLNDQGVVNSDSDELEGRFPAGSANLCTSSLYYDALISAAYLAESLGEPPSVSRTHRREATQLKKAISTYFEAKVEGFDTYRYYAGNDMLRSWICMPLTVGIHDRSQGTVDALLSPRLLMENGLLTQAGTETYWDRSTLYALRGIFATGATERGSALLRQYSNARLLGDHVPYPIEAWPEGNQRHLSAESGLYCRIVIEGIFGIRPEGLRKFSLTPRLPDGWDRMELNNVSGFGDGPFDLAVSRHGDRIQVDVSRAGKQLKSFTAQSGARIQVAL